jgi:hypothetical protein
MLKQLYNINRKEIELKSKYAVFSGLILLGAHHQASSNSHIDLKAQQHNQRISACATSFELLWQRVNSAEKKLVEKQLKSLCPELAFPTSDKTPVKKNSFWQLNGDTNAPKLVYLDIQPKVIDVTNAQQNVEVTVHFEEETDINYLSFWFKNDDLQQYGKSEGAYGDDIYKDPEDGLFKTTFTYTFTPENAPGTYSISSVLGLADTLNNRTYDYDGWEKLEALGFLPHLEVLNDNDVDITPPTIKRIEIDKRQIAATERPAQVTAKIVVQDESGMRSGGSSFWLRSTPNYVSAESGAEWLPIIEPNSFQKELFFNIDSGTVSGVYALASVLSLADGLGNYTSRYDDGESMYKEGFYTFLSILPESEMEQTDNSIVLKETFISEDSVTYKMVIDAEQSVEHELLIDNSELSEPPYIKFNATSVASSCYASYSSQYVARCRFSYADVDGDLEITFTTPRSQDKDFLTFVKLSASESRIDVNMENNFVRVNNSLLNEIGINDKDSDAVFDSEDNCPALANNNQLDTDSDGLGDICDSDDDNDGMPDVYEARVGLNPLVADADGDADGDGLTNLEEFEFGTDPFNADSDGDGINDKLDNNPTVPDESSASELGSGIPLLWQDVTGDGVTELGVFSAVDGVPSLSVVNLVNNAELSRITWATDAYLPSSITPIALPDMDGDGVMDVGLFGIRQGEGNEGKPQFFVRSGSTGNRVSVFNWPANWKNMQVMVMDDLTGDGVPEIALEGTFKDGARPQLRVQDGATGANVGVYSFPAIFDSPSYYQHSDYDGDGVNDVALFGRIKRNNKIQVKLISGANSNNKLSAYNFPDKWENVSWQKLFDMNGDSESEWGLFGTSREDGRTMLLVKDAADKRGLVASYAWPGMDSPTLLTIPDISGDDTPELAAAGLNTNTNRYQLQIKDGSDRNNTLNNITWPNRWSNVSFHVFDDMDGDGAADVALQGKNTSSGNHELIIVNALNRVTVATMNLGSDWDSAPTVYQIGDTDGDGVPNVVVFGINENKAMFTLH